MDTKLTLKLDEGIIEKAKLFAKSRETSLSNLIENYLQKLTATTDDKAVITPVVKSLSGIITLPKDYQDKEEYTKHLLEKYK